MLWKRLDVVHVQVKLRQEHQSVIRRCESFDITDLVLTELQVFEHLKLADTFELPYLIKG